MESLKPATLKESIHATVAYFDLFDYPLTPHELWTFLMYPPWVSVPLSIMDVLDASMVMEELEWIKGFVCLKGKGGHVQERIDRYLIAERKMNRALRFARACAYVPGVAMIAVCNTLAFSNSRDSSDIDFFIVAKRGYLWFVRASAIVLSMLFGKRLSERHIRDALCLSFFADDAALDFAGLSIPKHSEIDDVYLAVWVSRCVPLYNEGGAYERFWRCNAWSQQILPNRLEYVPNHMRRIRLPRYAQSLKRALTAMLAPFQQSIECACRAIQWKKFPDDIRRAAVQADSGVVITDSILKFHLNDRRFEFRDAFCERLRLYRKNSRKMYDTN